MGSVAVVLVAAAATDRLSLSLTMRLSMKYCCQRQSERCKLESMRSKSHQFSEEM